MAWCSNATTTHAPSASRDFSPAAAGTGTTATVTLYRRLLAESPDSSVVVVSVGFSTNLGRLLESWGDKYSPLDGIELVKRKVKFCSVMGGSFGDQAPRRIPIS